MDLCDDSLIGVGVIGLGIGAELARAAQEGPFGHVAAICDVSPSRLSALGDTFPGTVLTTHGMDLVEMPDVQAVIVATPDDQHLPYVTRALELGKSVLCEKPLALTEDELRRIVVAYQSVPTKPILTTNTLLRAAPRYAWLREEVREGRFGDILASQSGYFYGRFHKVLNGWRGAIADYSVVLGGGIHMIDLLTWTLGEWPVRVSALGSSRGSRRHGLDFPDTVEATLEFGSGLVASLSVSFASAFPHFHHFTLQGSAASFVNLPTGSALLVDSSGIVEEVHLPGHPSTKGVFVNEFLAACGGLADPAVSTRDSLYAAAVAISIDKSLAMREPVQLAPLLQAVTPLGGAR